MERTVSLIPEAFAGSQSLSAYRPLLLGDPPSTLFVPDALSNPEHLNFGLKGCLAAGLCYIIYTSVAWPGIIGNRSRDLPVDRSQHHWLISSETGSENHWCHCGWRFVIGMGAQVFILPYLDSIGGFTLLFIAVTIVAAWVATSSPRLSYFGVQLALAFYVINLQEFTIQTSLTVARDRVIGILLGLFMMWLVFDQLTGCASFCPNERALIALLRSLAKLARDPVAENRQAAIEQSYALRETINNGFDKVRALGDGYSLNSAQPVSRISLGRSSIRAWQPQLRLLFITRVALFRYRLQLPGFELPGALRRAQQDFDEHLARTLEAAWPTGWRVSRMTRPTNWKLPSRA